MDTPNGSGPGPERLAEHLERARITREHIAGELRELLETEQHLYDELAEQVAESRKRRDGYRRALDQLTGEAKQPRATTKPGSRDWQISDRKVAQVWEQVRRLDGAFTAAALAKDMPGLSPESARRALNVLRDRELVRATGIRIRGGGVSMAVMPGAGEQELTSAS